jgi:TfoX/Sxy family transcriptional regulator of competence genes
MAYDAALDERVDGLLRGRPGYVAKKMFGGKGYLCRGNLAAGLMGDELIVRLARPDGEAALSEPGVRRFRVGGRTMGGWVLVSPDVLEHDADLRDWLDRGWAHAASLPPK